MFTRDNCTFSDDARRELNIALTTLLADIDTDDPLRWQAEKSFSDRLNNAWLDGITADELIAKARLGRRATCG